MFGNVDWSHRGGYFRQNHGVTPDEADEADEAVGDPERVVIDPDYRSSSGRSVRIIGFSPTIDDLITVIVSTDQGVTYGVNAWRSNPRDCRIREEGEMS